MSESGYGMRVYVGDAAGNENAYVFVEGVQDVKPPAIVKVEKKRRDTHRQVSDPNYGAARFVIGKISDYGEVPLKLDRLTADPGQAALIAAGKSRARVYYKILFPEEEGGGGSTFQGLITDFDVNTPLDDGIEYEVKIQVTSKPVEVVG